MHRRSHDALVAVAVASLAVLTISSCGSSDASGDVAPTPATSTTSPSTTSPSTSPTKEVTVVDVTLTGSKISPAPDTVKVDEGTSMKVTITRDTPGEVHIHGYDLDQQAKAGTPVTFEFVADQQGVFEVEAHDPDLLLFKLQVN